MEFCNNAISNNPNLRAVREVSNEVVSQVYAFAWRRASALVKRLGRSPTRPVSSGVVTGQFRDRTDTEVKVEDLNPVQESKLLAKYKPGKCFGELALLYNTRRIGTAHATEDGERSGGRVTQRVHCVHCGSFVLTSTFAHQCTCLPTRHIHCLVCLGGTVLCVQCSTV